MIYLVMTSFVKFITQFIIATTLGIGFISNALADNEKIFIEITKSSHSETLGEIHALGFYSPRDKNSGLYVGMQIMLIENDALNKNNSTIKMFFGQQIGGRIAPFYEIGTDLYGFITLFDNSRQTHTCTADQQCAIDLFFRIGLRLKLSENITLGIFHENIDFGDFHENLSGEHRYVGSSFSLSF